MPTLTSSSTLAHGAVLAAIYALYAQYHFSGVSPTSKPIPWATPKQPFLLHHVLLQHLLLFLGLWIPADRAFVAAVIIPLIGASFWQLIGAGSNSPATGCAIGTIVSVLAFKTAGCLVFQDVRNEYRRYDTVGDERVRARLGADDGGEPYPMDSALRRAGWCFEMTENLRGVGWNWCVPLPAFQPSLPVSTRVDVWRWIVHRTVRGLCMWLWIDILIYYMRTMDKPFFVPAGHATGFFLPLGGVPYPSVFSRSTKPLLEYPPPLGFPAMPEADTWRCAAYQIALYVLRTLLSASGLFAAIDGLCTAFALLNVVPAAVLGISCTGWKARWFSPDAWPAPFGYWLAGDFGHGIKGWWARGWHSLFRNIFTAPADFVIRMCKLRSTNPITALVRLWVPFAMSAALHFSGCWTQSFGGWGAVRFFVLQPFGIMLETAIVNTIPHHRISPAVRRVIMYVWTTTWLLITSLSFFEEYRWGGLWVTETVPFSFIRAFRGERWAVWTKTHNSMPWWRWAVDNNEGGILGEWAVVIC
jgi:hypothetical protein